VLRNVLGMECIGDAKTLLRVAIFFIFALSRLLPCLLLDSPYVKHASYAACTLQLEFEFVDLNRCWHPLFGKLMLPSACTMSGLGVAFFTMVLGMTFVLALISALLLPGTMLSWLGVAFFTMQVRVMLPSMDLGAAATRYNDNGMANYANSTSQIKDDNSMTNSMTPQF
jgi:hypothetical protein